MDNKTLLKTIGFKPKENAVNVFHKKYTSHSDYPIEVDFDKERINFGNLINAENKSTQNFSQPENWVVLECVNRLLGKGYKPQNITLEKTWKTGHGTSGRLDILVSRDDSSAFLMIECKNSGAEFEKELKNIERNGGQLFTYFQQDKDADILMLYTSQFQEDAVEYKNIIVKIEEDYRQTGNVKDFFERWNKLPKTNGVFDSWVTPYEFQSKALTKNDLKVLKQEDSSFIFNRFLEILRHNVVSDKPNAFNKIFTLFLCKIIDEDRNTDEQLHFQWLEGEDDHISFQKRLTDLYNRGMLELLEKKVTDVSDSEFEKQFQQVEDQYKDKFKEILTEIRLKKNNEFAIKEVYDNVSFEDNAKVVKEVVELLQVYQLRYNYRQQFLSDFFELLLTTGLKQESGQFFTPVPIARFIIKSLPFPEITAQKIELGNRNDLLPTIIDYAAGSGHFLTESMEEVQKYIDNVDESELTPTTKRAIKKWKDDQFDWAENYIYGIEKDYRLVKTTKVSCYLHGDGLAKVIHGDGLGDFATSPQFKDLLKETDKNYPQDNKQFDILISNPPYSVSAFKGLLDEEKAKKGFELYDRLTDQSSEIECLFVERTKQLLKDGGVAGIILPSSILSNTGIYTQTREILLKYFEILGIAELGSNTFMATGTNTVTLFLRRRNNADAYNIEEAIKKCFVSLQDITINGIENPIAKYIAHVWDSISFEDYKTLIQKAPNENIEQHEIYKEYTKKIKAKSEAELWDNVLNLEQEKLLYFILAHPQRLVLIKTGRKSEEKQFLGYEFSNRRGSEGIHAIQRSKSIDDCTQLYDPESFTNTEKVSTYINRAFKGEFDLELPKNLQQNLSYNNLADMLTFDRVDFEKNIFLSAKRKVKIESKFNIVRIGQIAQTQYGYTDKATSNGKVRYLRITDLNDDGTIKIDNDIVYINPEKNIEKQFLLQDNDIVIARSGSVGKCAIYNSHKYEKMIFASYLIRLKVNPEVVLPHFLFNFTKTQLYWDQVHANSIAVTQPNLNAEKIKEFKIPLPPLDIQQKIIGEIKEIEIREEEAKESIEQLQSSLQSLMNFERLETVKLEDIAEMIKRGKSAKYGTSNIQIIKSGQARGYKKFDFSQKHYVDEKFVLDERQLKKGDVLINSSGVGTAGRVTLFNLSGVFVVDSHISILRPNLNKVLPDFLLYSLANIGFKNIEALAMGQSGQIELSLVTIQNIRIPLPTMEEQRKVVSEIEKIEAKIAELEKQIASIPQQKEAILKKYL